MRTARGRGRQLNFFDYVMRKELEYIFDYDWNGGGRKTKNKIHGWTGEE